MKKYKNYIQDKNVSSFDKWIFCLIGIIGSVSWGSPQRWEEQNAWSVIDFFEKS